MNHSLIIILLAEKKQLLYRKQINQSERTKSPHLVSQTIGNQALLDGSHSSIHHVRGGDDVTACTVKENHTGYHFQTTTGEKVAIRFVRNIITRPHLQGL